MEVSAPDVAGLYKRFAQIEAHRSSQTYERLCLAISEHDGVLAFLDSVPRMKRQPNLLLGALRLLGADVADPPAALALAVERADDLREVMLARSTQTNEPARCAVLLPALAMLPGPLAILEVGASAGLCLMYERYSYSYLGEGSAPVRVGDGSLTLPCFVDGVPLPDRVPEISARLGLDANPLVASDPDVARWLECLVWPEHTERADRLTAALSLAAADPPRVVRGLAPQDLPAAAEQLRGLAPEATLVVVHSATVAYLDVEERTAFAGACDDLGARRVGLEAKQVSADLGVAVPAAELGGRFLLTLDDAVLGHAHPHGQDLVWLA